MSGAPETSGDGTGPLRPAYCSPLHAQVLAKSAHPSRRVVPLPLQPPAFRLIGTPHAAHEVAHTPSQQLGRKGLLPP